MGVCSSTQKNGVSEVSEFRRCSWSEQKDILEEAINSIESRSEKADNEVDESAKKNVISRFETKSNERVISIHPRDVKLVIGNFSPISTIAPSTTRNRSESPSTILSLLKESNNTKTLINKIEEERFSQEPDGASRCR